MLMNDILLSVSTTPGVSCVVGLFLFIMAVVISSRVSRTRDESGDRASQAYFVLVRFSVIIPSHQYDVMTFISYKSCSSFRYSVLRCGFCLRLCFVFFWTNDGSIFFRRTRRFRYIAS